jgi:hypothetical protein
MQRKDEFTKVTQFGLTAISADFPTAGIANFRKPSSLKIYLFIKDSRLIQYMKPGIFFASRSSWAYKPNNLT